MNKMVVRCLWLIVSWHWLKPLYIVLHMRELYEWVWEISCQLMTWDILCKYCTECLLKISLWKNYESIEMFHIETILDKASCVSLTMICPFILWNILQCSNQLVFDFVISDSIYCSWYETAFKDRSRII